MFDARFLLGGVANKSLKLAFCSGDVRQLAKKISQMTENEKRLVSVLVEEIERQQPVR